MELWLYLLHNDPEAGTVKVSRIMDKPRLAIIWHLKVGPWKFIMTCSLLLYIFELFHNKTIFKNSFPLAVLKSLPPNHASIYWNLASAQSSHLSLMTLKFKLLWHFSGFAMKLFSLALYNKGFSGLISCVCTDYFCTDSLKDSFSPDDPLSGIVLPFVLDTVPGCSHSLYSSTKNPCTDNNEMHILLVIHDRPEMSQIQNEHRGAHQFFLWAAPTFLLSIVLCPLPITQLFLAPPVLNLPLCLLYCLHPF